MNNLELKCAYLMQTYMALYTTVEAIVNRLTGRGSSPMCNGNDTVSLYSLKVNVDIFGMSSTTSAEKLKKPFCLHRLR